MLEEAEQGYFEQPLQIVVAVAEHERFVSKLASVVGVEAEAEAEAEVEIVVAAVVEAEIAAEKQVAVEMEAEIESGESLS